MFDMSIATDNNTIRASLILDRLFFEPSLYEYAFYLFRDGEIVEKIFYSSEPSVRFIVSDNSGEFFIRYFIRDIRDKSKRSYNSHMFEFNAIS